jgi:hypothetical protein
MHGVYAQVLQDPINVKENTTSGKPTTQGRQPETEFREQRRRKRNPSQAKKPKTMATAGIKDPRMRPHHVPTKNFFAPLRATDIECEGNKSKDTDTQDEVQQEPSRKTGRPPPPPIVLTSQENLIAMQKLKGLCKGTFEFRSTRNGNGTRVITKEMADFSAIRTYPENQNLPYFTYLPKS